LESILLISNEKLVIAFRKARQIIEHKELYILDGKHIPVSIDDLCWVVGDMYGIDINLVLVDFVSQHLRGMVESNNHGTKSANVYVQKNQDSEWRRFIAAKELSQLIIDEEEDWNSLGVDTIDGLIKEEQFPQSDAECTEDDIAPKHLQSEMLAQAVALEILFPFEFREKCKQQCIDGLSTIDDLSQHFGIPEYAIMWAFNEHYVELSTETWAEVHSA
jgi:hypothetical protein